MPNGTLTCDVCRDRATGIEPAFSAWEAHRQRLHDLQLPNSQLKPCRHLFGGIRWCLLFALTCGTKSRESSKWHAVARTTPTISAMNAEGEFVNCRLTLLQVRNDFPNRRGGVPTHGNEAGSDSFGVPGNGLIPSFGVASPSFFATAATNVST